MFHKPMSALTEHILGSWAFLQPRWNDLSFLVILSVEPTPDTLILPRKIPSEILIFKKKTKQNQSGFGSILLILDRKLLKKCKNMSGKKPCSGASCVKKLSLSFLILFILLLKFWNFKTCTISESRFLEKKILTAENSTISLLWLFQILKTCQTRL